MEKQKASSKILFYLFLCLFIIHLTPLKAQWVNLYSNANVWSIAFSSTGNTWFLSSNGLIKNYGQQIFNSSNSPLPGTNLNQVVVDKFDNIWVATGTGIYIYNGVNWTIYTTSNSDLCYNAVNCLAIDESDTKWIGTQFGMSKLDSLGNWTTFTNSNSGLHTNSIKSIAVDLDQNIWIGGTVGGSVLGGLAKFDISGNWITYNTSNSNIPFDIIYSVTVDKQNNIWMACHNPNGAYVYGISMFNGQIFNNYNYSNTSGGLTDNWVTGIGIDQNNNKWVGTNGGGVCKFNDTTWTNFTKYNSTLSDNYIGILAINSFTNCVAVGYDSFDNSGFSQYCLSIGVDDLENVNNDIVIYPNPSTKSPDFYFNFPFKSAELFIFNLMGVAIKNYKLDNNFQSFSCEYNLEKGTYIYRFEIDKEVSYKVITISN